jgi:ABC-type branched-subunit amino acid transport system substrate-binding protein
MRLPLSLSLPLSFTALLGSGCALVHGLGDYSFAGDTNDTPVATAGEAPIVPRAVQCHENSECNEGQVCVSESCVSLKTPQCPRIAGHIGDDAIILGALLSEGTNSATDALEAAAFLAVEEINASRTMPPLAVVGCNASGDILSGTRHLVEELHVPAIVGPTAAEDVVDVTQQISARGGTLIMTPTAAVSAISQLADEGLTWRALPSDGQRAKLVIQQMQDLETLLRNTRSLTTVNLGIVHASDARGESAYEAIRGKLILNGRFITDPANEPNVSVDTYAPGALQSALAGKYADAFKADIVFITAVEQVTGFIVPLEQALTEARAVNRPYYVVTDAAKTDVLLGAIASLPADAKRRIRGVGMKPDPSSAPVLADFGEAYATRYGTEPPLAVASAAAVSYDAMYAIAYAIAATSDRAPTGAGVAQGLRTLGVGEAAAVGAKQARSVIEQLESRKSVSLRGTFAPLQWDASGDLSTGTVEVWCIGTRDGTPIFGGSGLTMDVQTQVVGGAFVQCQ